MLCRYVVVCPAQSWGKNCENLCRCEDSVCDRATGCTSCGDLYRGWTGPNCDEDINECSDAVRYCGANSDCTNTNGSYTCDCHYWYQRVSGQVDRCECKCLDSFCTSYINSYRLKMCVWGNPLQNCRESPAIRDRTVLLLLFLLLS